MSTVVTAVDLASDQYTKAVARMMMFWLCQTRGDLALALADGATYANPGEWGELAELLEDIGEVAFNKNAPILGVLLKDHVDQIHFEADKDWQYKKTTIGAGCPSNKAINDMYACLKQSIAVGLEEEGLIAGDNSSYGLSAEFIELIQREARESS